jgi:hypothetical protein
MDLILKDKKVGSKGRNQEQKGMYFRASGGFGRQASFT